MADDMAELNTAPEQGTLEAAMPPSTATSRMSSGKVTVNNRFDIDLSRPLHDFEHACAEAYECTALDTGVADHIALVIRERFPVRQEVISALVNADIENMIALRLATVIDWPQSGAQRFVMIYKHPGGNAIMQRHVARRDPISEDILRNSIIRPLFYTLRHFADRGLFHGAIRPDNVFLAAQADAEIVLGECASALPGFNQPAMFDTIERAMADRHGKGVGTALDDVYSFGATVAVLSRGFNPMEGKPDSVIIDEKIQRSSFSVFTDGMRLSPGLAELLRSTLSDDPKQRWTIEQVAAWVDGTRTTPKQAVASIKAQRALDFNGRKYMRPRVLAKDLHQNVSEAVSLIEMGHVAKWVERALMDQEMADAINGAINRAGVGGRTQGYEDRLLCFVSMALDPRAPIRFRDLRVFPAGIGYGMAWALSTGQPIQTYGEIIRDRYGWVWLSYKENIPGETRTDLQRHLDQASKTIIRRGIDYGPERALYDLCPHAPCMSDMLKQHYAINCGLVLRALDNVASQYKGTRAIDRHIAAFIGARDSRDNTGFLSLLESADAMRKSLALITIYQGIQKRYDNPKLVALCEWLVKEAEIVAQRFHSQNLKQEIIRQIPKEVKTGNLARMMTLIDNPQQVKKDEYDFAQAGRSYIGMHHEKEYIRKGLERDPEFGMSTGRHMALVISVIISGVMIASTIFLNFSGGGMH
jgi:hypothetical protein